MSIDHKILDPIHGRIAIPDWLREIESFPSVRRMLYIRQLGLKSSIDFPGAIHTRYGHSLGVMHLAGVFADNLSVKMDDHGKSKIKKNLQNNKNNLMAAGFLHDVAHGPYSHALDFVLRKNTGTTHEELSAKVINNELKQSLTDHGLNPEAIIQIINNKHDFEFISGIINSPIDVDKLDYLLRDAYHVGLKYNFDLDYFGSSYTVLGDETKLSKCKLGLSSDPNAQVTAEIFIIIWKGMYDLVYHAQESRIAEKMLEKAAILEIKKGSELKKYFKDEKFLLTLEDEKLRTILENSSVEYTQKLEERIHNRKLFTSLPDIKLYDNLEIDSKFKFKIYAAGGYETDNISDQISNNLCKELGFDEYNIICDIVKTRIPGTVFIDDKDDKSADLNNVSDLIKGIKQHSLMRIYVDPECKSKVPKEFLPCLKNAIEMMEDNNK